MFNFKKPVRSRSKKARRVTATPSRGKKNTSWINYYVPALFILAMTGCLIWLLAAAYQKVTASSFFDTKNIEVYGTQRSSNDEIKRTVQMAAAKSGVWNADITDIRVQIERLPWVRSAVVSRVLPDGLRVRVKENVPVVAVRSEKGELQWADAEAEMLGPVAKEEAASQIVMRGWDERKTDGAQKINQQRVKLYQKMVEELRVAGLEKTVSAVNIADLEDAQAFVDQSGNAIPVSLGKEDFGRRLQDAMKTLELKDTGQVASLISRGKNVVVVSR